MGQGLVIQTENVPSGEQTSEEILAEALEARDRLLKEHPELIEFQKEIDRRLSRSGSHENRMAVLGIMMAAKVQELSQHMTHLLALVSESKK